jgi:hypothetical protein
VSPFCTDAFAAPARAKQPTENRINQRFMILPFQKLHSHWLSGQPTTTKRHKEQSSRISTGLSLTLI